MRSDGERASTDRKSTRLNSSHLGISYAVFCLKKKNTHEGCSKYRQRVHRNSATLRRARAVVVGGASGRTRRPGVRGSRLAASFLIATAPEPPPPPSRQSRRSSAA